MPLYRNQPTWRVLAASAVAASITGTLVETTLATITIPAGAMGANGLVRVTSLWSYTNSANVKTLRARLGASALVANTYTTTASAPLNFVIGNRNAQNSQISGVASGLGASSAVAPFATAIDTSASTSLLLQGTLANTGETITLESYVAELLYQA